MPIIRTTAAASRFVDALLGSWKIHVAQEWKDAAVVVLLAGEETGLTTARRILDEGIQEARARQGHKRGKRSRGGRAKVAVSG